jgi:predicted TIM-barrel fold metal-dependent hydrolase
MPRCDVHQHLWPDSLVAALQARSKPPCLDGSLLTIYEGAFELDLDADRLERRLAELDAHGLDVAFTSLQPTLGIEDLPAAERHEVWAAYDEGILEVAARSGGRIRPLSAGAARPGFAGASVRAAALLELDTLAPVADALVEIGGFLFVHPGPTKPAVDVPWWSAVVEYTAQMQAAYAAWLAQGRERWPELPVVLAILAGGAPIQLERMTARGFDAVEALEADVYFDTASYGPRALRLALDAFGPERLLFGSDAPVIEPGPTLAAVESLGPEAAGTIVEKNFARFL